MQRTNRDEPTRLLVSVAYCVLTTTIWAQGACAETIFFDDFNDGNAGDGMPVTWVPGPGTWDASSGDYVATGSLPSRISRVSDRVFGDISARTQARVVGNVSATLGVRQGNQGYAGTIQPNGTMAIARLDAPDSPILLGSAVVPFNPVQEDVMLQFDAFGDKLSLWAWPVGQPMPTEPQVVAFDNTYAEGPFGLVSAAFAASPTDSTTFRFVHVANTHIPEPSTLVLMSLGGCGLLYARRRKRAQPTTDSRAVTANRK
jgi:hypothetical protein